MISRINQYQELYIRLGVSNCNYSFATQNSMEDVVKDFERCKSNYFRFPEDLMIRETVPGQDTSAELEMIVHCEEKVDVNCLNEYGHTPLGTAAFVGSMKCCEVLIQLGADVDKRDADRWTALHYAMARGYLDTVKYLVFCGGDIHALNNDGESPLDFTQDDGIRQLLLDCFEEHSKRNPSIEV